MRDPRNECSSAVTCLQPALRLTPRGLLRGQKPISQAPNVGPRSINTERNAGRGPRPSQPPARGPASPPPGAASPEQERGNREGREGNAFFLFQFFTQNFSSPIPIAYLCKVEKYRRVQRRLNGAHCRVGSDRERGREQTGEPTLPVETPREPLAAGRRGPQLRRRGPRRQSRGVWARSDPREQQLRRAP